MKNLAFLVFAVATAALARASTYTNPILTMDFSDPDVCIGGDGRAYMTASSFGGLPGLPILVSDDLVNWSYVGYALAEHPFDTESPEHGNAVWAPSIRYRADKGEYVIYWGDPDRGIYRVSAPSPDGPWGKPRLVKAGKGIIDVCPLYDDDGRIYLVHAWAASRAGMNSVLSVCRLDADETAPVEDDTLVYDGIPDGNFTAEGPKFYKRDGEYWVLFPAGGVGEGWQVAMRSKSPYGPYEARTVMAQGGSSINGPHQGGWIHTRAGEDWFVHFSDRDAYGRIVYLQPLQWRADGWPVIGSDPDGDGCGEPVESCEMPKGGSLGRQCLYPQLDDEFAAASLGPQWQYLGKSRAQLGFPTRQGFFRLYSTQIVGAATNTWETPNIIVQKFPAFSFSATMKARVGAKQDGEEAGIIIQGRSYARLGLRSAGDDFELVYTECIGADKGNAEKPRVVASISADIIGAGIRSARLKDVWLRVNVAQGPIPPKMLGSAALCTFSYSLDGESWTPVDASFTASVGKWIGATIGFYAIAPRDAKDRGWIDVDYFRIAR